MTTLKYSTQECHNNVIIMSHNHNEYPLLYKMNELFLRVLEVLHNSCNTGTHGLPDMYTLSPRALGVHIRQTTRACVTTIKCILDTCNLIRKYVNEIRKSYPNHGT